MAKKIGEYVVNMTCSLKNVTYNNMKVNRQSFRFETVSTKTYICLMKKIICKRRCDFFNVTNSYLKIVVGLATIHEHKMWNTDRERYKCKMIHAESSNRKSHVATHSHYSVQFIRRVNRNIYNSMKINNKKVMKWIMYTYCRGHFPMPTILFPSFDRTCLVLSVSLTYSVHLSTLPQR